MKDATLCLTRFGFLAVLIHLLGSVSCSVSPAVEGACDDNTDCKPGDVCWDGACYAVCNVQSDCPEDLVCGTDGICVAREEGAPPTILGVRGNAPGDGSTIKNGLVVTGANLDSASFELRGEDGPASLTAVSATPDEAHLLLPQDVRTGSFTLVAVNLAGEDQADVTLTLPELDGDTLVDRINSEATTQLASTVLPVGTGTNDVAAGNHVHSTLYYTKSEVDAAIAGAGSGLTAGDGININTGVVAVDTTVARTNTAAGDQVFGANLLTVSHSSGGVGIGTSDPGAELDVIGDVRASGDYRYSNPRQRHVVLLASDFIESGHSSASPHVIGRDYNHSIYKTVGDGWGEAYASVHLPHGVKMTTFACVFTDTTSDSDPHAHIARINFDDGVVNIIAEVNTGGANDVSSGIYSTAIPAQYAVVDSGHGYHIYVNLGTEDNRVTALRRCRVSYEIEEL